MIVVVNPMSPSLSYLIALFVGEEKKINNKGNNNKIEKKKDFLLQALFIVFIMTKETPHSHIINKCKKRGIKGVWGRNSD